MWDIESRVHLGALPLGATAVATQANKGRWSPLTAVTVTSGHPRCLLAFARGGSNVVEVMHLQRQAERPGHPGLLAVLEPKLGLDTKGAGITALASSSAPEQRMLAAGSSDGILTVFWCPWMGEPGEASAAAGVGGPGGGGPTEGSAGDRASSAASAAMSMSRRDLEGALSSGSDSAASPSVHGGSASGASAAAAAGPTLMPGTKKSLLPPPDAARILFSAAVSPEYAIVGGRLRRVTAKASTGGNANPSVHGGSGSGTGGQPSASPAGGGPGTPSITSDFPAEPITAIAFHPSLPLVAAADAAGRLAVWRIGLADGRHELLGCRTGVAPLVSPDESPYGPGPAGAGGDGSGGADGAAGGGGDGSLPRVVTSLWFHPTSARLYVMAYCPSAPSLPPLIAAYCTAHSSLPPLPRPTSPSLRTLLSLATTDPFAVTTAHMTLPPQMLNCISASGGAAGVGGTPLVWAAGRVVVTSDVVSGAAPALPALDQGGGGDGEGGGGGGEGGEGGGENDEEPEALPSIYSLPRPHPALVSPLIPHGGSGITYSAPIVDVLTAPRSWFVDGGEGDGIDTQAAPLDGDTSDPSADGDDSEEEDSGDSGSDSGGSDSNDSSGRKRRRQGGSSGKKGKKKKKSALDDPFGGSLADFAAKLTGASPSDGDGSKTAANGEGNGTTSDPLLTPSGVPRAPVTAAALAGSASATASNSSSLGALHPPAIDAVVYIQSRAVVATDPTRVATQHSLQVRPLGPPNDATDGGGSGDGKGGQADEELLAAELSLLKANSNRAGGSKDKASTSGASSAPNGAAADTGPFSKSKRLCWLPSYGPGGPLIPLSITHSPSGRFVLVRFAYHSEAEPEKAAIGLAGTAMMNAAAGKGKVSSTKTSPSDSVMFVVVGPLPVSTPANTGGLPSASASATPLGGQSDAQSQRRLRIAFETLSGDAPVSGLSSAVDVALLSGDRLLTVRRPENAHVAAVAAIRGDDSASAAAATEYGVYIEPLLDDEGSDDDSMVKKPTAVGLKPALLTSSSGQQMAQKKQQQPVKFSVHEPVVRVFPTPFSALLQQQQNGAGSTASGSGSDDATAASGEVLLYATRLAHPDDPDVTPSQFSSAALAFAGSGGGPSPSSVAGGRSRAGTAIAALASTAGLGLVNRVVLRYSNNGYGPYSQNNPHAYAVSDAHQPFSVSSHAAPTAASSLASQQAAEHKTAAALLPHGRRPFLLLQPGEAVIKATWSGPEAVAGDSGIHDPAAEKHLTSASAPANGSQTRIAASPNLPSAIATGGPLLALLTSHRLLILTPALQPLVSLPVMLPLASTVGPGLGGRYPMPFGGKASSLGRLADASLACVSFAVSSPAGSASNSNSGGGAKPSSPTATVRHRPPLPHSSIPGESPLDGSASMQGGVVVSTVAAMGASAARLTVPLPATRASDSQPHDDVSDDVLLQLPFRTPIVSHTWAGSAILLTTGSSEVYYVTPLGRARRLCALEIWQRDAALVTATGSSLVYATTNPGGGRTQVRYRPFSPLEPLLCATLDHAAVRPVLSADDAGAAALHPVVSALSAYLPPVSIALYGRLPPQLQQQMQGASKDALSGKKGAKGADKGQPLPVTVVTLAATSTASVASSSSSSAVALAGAHLMSSLARDYCFVRDCVVRYAHPHRGSVAASSAFPSAGDPAALLPAQQSSLLRESSGSEWGVTRTAVASLAEAGLLDLAFYAAQGAPDAQEAGTGHPFGIPPGGIRHTSGGGGGGGGEDEEEGGGPSGPHGKEAAGWYNEVGALRRAAAFPWYWRAELALARGRPDQALWCLLGEEPALAAAVLAITKATAAQTDEEEDHDPAAAIAEALGNGAVKLPHPASPLAASLRALGRACASLRHWKLSVLCWDLAGDHAAAMITLLTAASSSGDKSKGGALHLTPAQVDAALTALVGVNLDRFPATAIVAAAARKAGADAANAAAQAAKAKPTPIKPASSSHSDSEDDYDDDDDSTSDSGSRDHADEATPFPSDTTSLLDSVRFNRAFTIPALGRQARYEGLLPLDYKMPAVRVATGAGSSCSSNNWPFAPLFDGGATLAAMVASSSGAAASASSSAIAAVLYSHAVAVGSTANPSPSPPLLSTPHGQLSLDTLQRWLGTVRPAHSSSLLKSGAGKGGASASADADDDGAGGDGLDCGLGGFGGAGGDTAPLDPISFAWLAAQGKRKLRPLPRGAEDAVIGYWRFEKGEEESGGEKVRERELRRLGKWGPKASPADTAAGLWGIAHGPASSGSSGGSKEPLSPFPSPVVDLSKQRSDGLLFDALLLLARVRDAASALKLAPLPPSSADGPTSAASYGPNDLAPVLRAGFAAGSDAPYESGDVSKVREARLYVAGVRTLLQAAAAAAGGSDASGGYAVPPSPGPQVPLFKAPAGAVAGAGPAASSFSGLGLPPVPLTPSLRLLCQLCSWAVAVPVARYSYADVGLRPFDPTNAVFTIEAWVKPGMPYGAASSSSSGTDDFGGDDDGEGGSSRGGGGKITLQRPLIIASRAERYHAPSATVPNAAAASSVPLEQQRIRHQWSLSLQPDGALAFTAFPWASATQPASVPTPTSLNALPGAPDAAAGSAAATAAAAGAAAPGAMASPSVVSSPAGCVPLGEWRHVAVVVDGSAAAKESALRLKVTARAMEAGRPVPALAAWDRPLPDASVRLLVDGEVVGEGKVKTAMPLPLLEAPLNAAADAGAPPPPQPAVSPDSVASDYLLFGPDFVGRMGEVRLWAKKRSPEEIGDGKDFHLDLAETKKTRMQINIKPATLPGGGSTTAALAAPSSAAASATPPIGLAAPGAAAAAASGGPSAALSMRRLGAPGGLQRGISAPSAPSPLGQSRASAAASSAAKAEGGGDSFDVDFDAAPSSSGAASSSPAAAADTGDDDFGFSSFSPSSSSSSSAAGGGLKPPAASASSGGGGGIRPSGGLPPPASRRRPPGSSSSSSSSSSQPAPAPAAAATADADADFEVEFGASSGSSDSGSKSSAAPKDGAAAGFDEFDAPSPAPAAAEPRKSASAAPSSGADDDFGFDGAPAPAPAAKSAAGDAADEEFGFVGSSADVTESKATTAAPVADAPAKASAAAADDDEFGFGGNSGPSAKGSNSTDFGFGDEEELGNKPAAVKPVSKAATSGGNEDDEFGFGGNSDAALSSSTLDKASAHGDDDDEFDAPRRRPVASKLSLGKAAVSGSGSSGGGHGTSLSGSSAGSAASSGSGGGLGGGLGRAPPPGVGGGKKAALIRARAAQAPTTAGGAETAHPPADADASAQPPPS